MEAKVLDIEDLTERVKLTSASHKGVVYVVGGYSKDGVDYNDMWILGQLEKGGALLRQKMASSLKECNGMSIVVRIPLDSSGDVISGKSEELVVCGGQGNKDCYIYNIKLKKWKKIAPLSVAISNHTCVYGGKVDSLILFGGTVNDDLRDETVLVYKFGEKKWKSWKSGQFPSHRLDHSAIMWETGNRMVVFGGIDGEDQCLNDVWSLVCTPSLNHATGMGLKWVKLSTTGQAPSPRSRHAATYSDDRMFVFGGSNEEFESYNDLYELDLETKVWTQISLSNPPCPRDSHLLEVFDLDEDTGRMKFVVGLGQDSNFKVLSDLYIVEKEKKKIQKVKKVKEEKVYEFSVFLTYGIMKKQLTCKVKNVNQLVEDISNSLGLKSHEISMKYKSGSDWKVFDKIDSLPLTLHVSIEDK